MRSLITDPMSWWPVGIVIGCAIGAAVNGYENRPRAGTRDPADRATDAEPGRDSGGMCRRVSRGPDNCGH
jgi:hypothetical protein